MGIGILYLNLNNLTEITASIEPIYMIAGILTVIVSFIFGMKQAKYDKKRWKMEKRREEKSKTNFEVEDLNQSRITFCGDQTVRIIFSIIVKNYSDTPLIIEKIWLEIFTDSHNINLNSDGTSSDVKKGSTVAPHNVIEGDVCFNLGKQTYNSIAVNEYRVHLKDVTGYEKEIIEILVNEA